MMSSGQPEGTEGSVLSPLTDETQKDICEHLETMTEATFKDFANYLDVSGEPDLDWITAVDAFYDEKAIAELIDRSDPSDDTNDYKTICIEIGMLIAHVLPRMCDDLEWIADSPYWESALLHVPSQQIIPPVHWGIKKLSGYGWNDGIAAKMQMCVGVAEREMDSGD